MISSLARENNFARDVVIVFASSLLIGFIGRLEIPLPFTPVPISFRLQLVLLLSLILGSRKALLATALFLCQGACGLPVFAGGTCALFGPCCGYIVGYLFAAYFAGSIYEKTKNGSLAFIIGTIPVYVFGYLYLAGLIGFEKALYLGVLPFLPGCLIKSMIFLKGYEYFRKRVH